MEQNKPNGIWAVVVTYNRLELLKNNINSIRKQKLRPDTILVIDNGSTDETLSWIKLQSDLHVITQPNLGGAGGFYTGFKYAYDNGANWVWAMDDDGVAEEETLIHLWNSLNEDIYLVNSIVLAMNSTNRLASAFAEHFSLTSQVKPVIHYNLDTLIDKYSNERLVMGLPFFFNSTLIHRYVFEQVGFPNKAFFIRGDEMDFYYRMLSKDFKVYTNILSKYYHPTTISKEVSFLGKKFFYESMNSFKFYYHVRNTYFLRNKYFTKSGIMALAFYQCLDILVKEIIILMASKVPLKIFWSNIITYFKAKKDAKKEWDKLDANKYW